MKQRILGKNEKAVWRKISLYSTKKELVEVLATLDIHVEPFLRKSQLVDLVFFAVKQSKNKHLLTKLCNPKKEKNMEVQNPVIEEVIEALKPVEQETIKSDVVVPTLKSNVKVPTANDMIDFAILEDRNRIDNIKAALTKLFNGTNIRFQIHMDPPTVHFFGGYRGPECMTLVAPDKAILHHASNYKNARTFNGMDEKRTLADVMQRSNSYKNIQRPQDIELDMY